ncbi:MAG: DUF3710 domain-containing protein [Nocardioides sp.]|uniref:DUF3710 domain-containing protein n=1 Tax=Nocardioides sp. TaxID=35761 RepID=UPI0039E3C811
MKFLRRAKTRTATDGETAVDQDSREDGVAEADGAEESDETGAEETAPAGPYDADETPEDLVDDSWVDLGSLLVAPAPGKELRLQVDEASGAIASVLLAAEDGALELRAFAAPRDGDLWSEALPLLRADVAQRGGATSDREGPWGAELLCQLTVQTPDGQTGVQASRIIGVNGSRWMLRATLLGRPAVDEEAGREWEQLLGQVVVRRGKEAKPKGEALPVVLPANAHRVDAPEE